MSFLNSIGNLSATPPPHPGVTSSPALAPRITDERHGQRSRFDNVLSDPVLGSSFRIARARAIREEILNRTYETPERIEKTVERLLDVIG